MDMISLYQNGVKNVAASLGTALTNNQARLLCRYSKNIVLSYDSDQAGINAALRGIDVINEAGGKPRVLTVTDGKDPDDFIKAHGKEEFLRLVDNAVPATDYKLGLAKRGFDLTNDNDVLEYVERIIPVLKSLGPVELDIYTRKLSEELGISDHAISMAVRADSEKTRRESAGVSRARNERKIRDNAVKNDNSGYYERYEMAFAILAMRDPRYIKRLEQDGIKFEGALTNKVMLALKSLYAQSDNAVHGIDKERVFEALDPEEESVFRKAYESIQTGPDEEIYYNETKAGYLKAKYRDEKVEVTNRIAVAEKMGQTAEIDELAARLMELDMLINKLTEEN